MLTGSGKLDQWSHLNNTKTLDRKCTITCSETHRYGRTTGNCPIWLPWAGKDTAMIAKLIAKTILNGHQSR